MSEFSAFYESVQAYLAFSGYPVQANQLIGRRLEHAFGRSENEVLWAHVKLGVAWAYVERRKIREAFHCMADVQDLAVRNAGYDELLLEHGEFTRWPFAVQLNAVYDSRTIIQPAGARVWN